MVYINNDRVLVKAGKRRSQNRHIRRLRHDRDMIRALDNVRVFAK